jgi:hypothetical protein
VAYLPKVVLWLILGLRFGVAIGAARMMPAEPIDSFMSPIDGLDFGRGIPFFFPEFIFLQPSLAWISFLA